MLPDKTSCILFAWITRESNVFASGYRRSKPRVHRWTRMTPISAAMTATPGMRVRVNVMLMTYVSYVGRGKNRFDVWARRASGKLLDSAEPTRLQILFKLIFTASPRSQSSWSMANVRWTKRNYRTSERSDLWHDHVSRSELDNLPATKEKRRNNVKTKCDNSAGLKGSCARNERETSTVLGI